MASCSLLSSCRRHTGAEQGGAGPPGAPCLFRISQESFRVSSVILCFLLSPPSLCCLSQTVLWNMIRFQLQAAAFSHVGPGFKLVDAFVGFTYSCVLHFVQGDN